MNAIAGIIRPFTIRGLAVGEHHRGPADLLCVLGRRGGRDTAEKGHRWHRGRGRRAHGKESR